MNALTVAVFAALLAATGAAASYVWRVRLKARSRWFVRFAFALLAFYGVGCIAGLVLLHNDPLSGGLLVELILYLWLPANVAFFVRENTRPSDPALLRYPYRPTKRDLRLIWLTFAALSVPVLVVLLVAAAHSLD